MSNSKWVGEPDSRIEQAERVADAGHSRAKTSGGTALCANKTSSGTVSVAPWHGEVALQWHGVVLK